MKTVNERNEIAFTLLKEKFDERCETEKHELSLKQIILFGEVFSKVKQAIPETSNSILTCMLLQPSTDDNALGSVYRFELYNPSPNRFIKDFILTYNNRLEMGK